MKSKGLAASLPETTIEQNSNSAAVTKTAKVDSTTARYRLGKDEMNLVEHPFALLKRGTSDNVIHLEWEKIHPRSGKNIRASWHVEGSSELGLPGPVEERLYLVLMELSREQGWTQKVQFSRHDILNRLGITKNSSNYKMIHESFLRLKTVTIDARRSFWNASCSDFLSSIMFNIIDEVQLVDEGPGRRRGEMPLALSSFKWSDVMFESLIAGNIRSIPIEFALSLDSPLAARLFRYLDKHRTGDSEAARHKFEIELHRLCEIHLGMAKAKYNSTQKARLEQAHTELISRRFLLDIRYEPMKSSKGQEKVVYYFTNKSLDCKSPSELVNVPSIIEDGVEDRPSDSPLTSAVSSPESPRKSLADVLFEWDSSDPEKREIACDAVFETLDELQKSEIDTWARTQLAPFLQNSMSSPGARRGMVEKRRARVGADYSDLVNAYIRQNAEEEAKRKRNNEQ